MTKLEYGQYIRKKVKCNEVDNCNEGYMRMPKYLEITKWLRKNIFCIEREIEKANGKANGRKY